MHTYAFQDLDERAQSAAIKNYGETQVVEEMVSDLINSCDTDLTARNVFSLLGWRFTEHGERIG